VNDDTPDATDEQLRRRMQLADPSREEPADQPWVSELLEATMSTSPVQTERRTRHGASAVAAVAALVALSGGYLVLNDNGGGTQEPSPTAVNLALPGGGGTSIGSCIPFDPKVLRDMPVAFSGTATEVGAGTVTLKVDRWYQGGSADVVRLDHYDAATVSTAGFEFAPTKRYLITATGGTVNFCGYSGEWTADLAGAFDSAFAP
jgi:hypothetical protein